MKKIIVILTVLVFSVQVTAALAGEMGVMYSQLRTKYKSVEKKMKKIDKKLDETSGKSKTKKK